ncbi:hypothetical protein F383_07471 [Gossypium arboreum]|uniref:Uncharacterized protein n=1 Tax=Gossypium arboreum TaxID=29729 RepID=A0A0B0MK33_GOSAR|nr:hypothetical protein F383_07471 [Gossypium arboreum]
MESGFMET